MYGKCLRLSRCLTSEWLAYPLVANVEGPFAKGCREAEAQGVFFPFVVYAVFLHGERLQPDLSWVGLDFKKEVARHKCRTFLYHCSVAARTERPVPLAN